MEEEIDDHISDHHDQRRNRQPDEILFPAPGMEKSLYHQIQKQRRHESGSQRDPRRPDSIKP